MTLTEVKTDRAAIRAAFATLRKKGYIAKMNFMCCSSCAWYEIGGKALSGHQRSDIEEPKKAVFYNKQSHESAFREKSRGWSTKSRRYISMMLQNDLCLQWSGDAKEIIAALEAEGLKVEWNGTDQNTINVVKR